LRSRSLRSYAQSPPPPQTAVGAFAAAPACAEYEGTTEITSAVMAAISAAATRPVLGVVTIMETLLECPGRSARPIAQNMRCGAKRALADC
jgi:hypothetical protein